jgi:DNA repair photolyase
MSDPYVHAETRYGLTARALELLAARDLGIHVVTKSDLITRDIEVLGRLAKVRATVAFTVTTADEALARVLEPGAPGPGRRFAAMAQLAGAGVTVGVTLMPVLPFVEDSVGNVVSIVERCAAAGGRFVIAWFGMTLRDRQREHYYRELDKHFPGVRARYEAAFGSRYSAACPDAGALHQAFVAACTRHGLICSMSELVASVSPRVPRQERLF